MNWRRKRLGFTAAQMLLAILASVGDGAALAAQAKTALVTGSLYRVHAGFLEVKSGEKNILVVKVDSATIYWNGKADKAASARDMVLGDELAIQIVEKKGLPVAEKVRFLHRD